MKQLKMPDCLDHVDWPPPGCARAGVSEPVGDDHAAAAAPRTTSMKYTGRLALRVLELSSPPGMGGRAATILDHYCQREHALDLVRNSDDAVLVVPPCAEQPIRRTVVAVDFSLVSARAAIAALEVTEHQGRVSLVHVASTTRHVGGRLRSDAAVERDSAPFAQFLELLHGLATVRLDTVTLSGDPVGALLRYADEQEADLVACGLGRRASGDRGQAGRVPTSLVRGASCRVLLVPEDRS